MAYHSGGSEMGVSHSRNRLCNSDKGTSNKHQHNNIRNNGCSNSNNSIHPPPPSSPSNHTLKDDDGGEDPNRKLRVKKENLQAELPLSWIQTHKSSSSSSFLHHRRHRHVNNTVQSLLEPPNIKQEAVKVEDKFSSTENEKEAVSSSKRKKKRSRNNRTLFAHKKKKTKMASKSGSKSSKSSQAKLDTLFPKTTTRSNEKEVRSILCLLPVLLPSFFCCFSISSRLCLFAHFIFFPLNVMREYNRIKTKDDRSRIHTVTAKAVVTH